MIPVVSDGLKPFTVYAARRPRQGCKNAGCAIVVGGLGVGAAKTRRIMKLPAAVTLAFTPYVRIPPSWPNGRSAQRHEILLQIRWSRRLSDNDPVRRLAHHARRRAEPRPAVLAPQPIPGYAGNRQLHGWTLVVPTL